MDNDDVESKRLDGLVRRWTAGDRSVFEAIVTATEGEMRAFAISRSRTIADAEEAVQSAYVIAFEHMSEYEPRGTFLSWLKGIARNRMLEMHRELMRNRHDDLDQALAHAWEDQATTIGDDGMHRRLQALQGCLQALDERSRRIMERHHLDGLQLNELAQFYRRPRQAIARLLFTVRGRLRDCIERQIMDESNHA